jgi:serine/threonine-protein kinase
MGGGEAKDDRAGARVADKYELRRKLGAGAMGAVYEGVHVDIGKRLAIKLVHPEFCESPEVVARFRREARAASAVESEHIVQIFDFGRDPKLGLYMVIEYLDGEDLEMRLTRERWLDVHSAATIGWQIARGLARAHTAGIVHRDLKPANVFLTERDDGSLLAKVLDFGISKFEQDLAATSAAPEPTLTAYGTTLGTPQYMSPEQCEGKDALDGRTDVWALCAVIYEMLAGEPAVPDTGGYIATMQRIVRSDVPPLADRASWVPPRLARIVDAGLVRNRDARIPDAVTLADLILEAYPGATSHGALPVATLPTDVSELAPIDEPAAAMEVNAARESGALEAPRVPPELAAMHDANDDPPPSDAPASSGGDQVEIFLRNNDLPSGMMRVARRSGPKEN